MHLTREMINSVLIKLRASSYCSTPNSEPYMGLCLNSVLYEEIDKMFILYAILNNYITKGGLNQTPYHVKEDQEEINKIASRLGKNEIVEIVARQSKFKPGGSAVTPATIFVTDKRIIIRKPTMLGARERIDAINFDQITSIQLGKGVFSSTVKLRAYGYQEDIESIQKDKAEKIVEYTRNAIADISKERTTEQSTSVPQQQALSLADELSKLAKLKEQGVLSEEELRR